MRPVAAHPDFLAFRIKRLHMLAAQRMNDLLKPYGLARGQFHVLVRVAAAGTLSQRELQIALKVEPATLTGTIDTLVARGWVAREGSPEDRRCKLLRLTPEGQALVARIPDPREIIEQELTGGLSDKRRDRLARDLDAMIANLEASL